MKFPTHVRTKKHAIELANELFPSLDVAIERVKARYPADSENPTIRLLNHNPYVIVNSDIEETTRLFLEWLYDARPFHHQPDRRRAAGPHRSRQPDLLAGVAHQQARDEVGRIFSTAHHQRLAGHPICEGRQSMNSIFTLRAGDVIRYAGQNCQVLRVTESAAVIAVMQKPRTIVPRFGKPVTIQPSPKHAWISPNSQIPILNR